MILRGKATLSMGGIKGIHVTYHILTVDKDTCGCGAVSGDSVEWMDCSRFPFSIFRRLVFSFQQPGAQ